MKLHEFQAKQVLARFGVATPRGVEATTVDAAVAAYHELKSPVAVVKAQIHAGWPRQGGRRQGRASLGKASSSRTRPAPTGSSSGALGRSGQRHRA
jgi:hypothetical protein